MRQPPSPTYSNLFKKLIKNNICYWLTYAQQDVDKLLNQVPHILRGISYALQVPNIWELTQKLILELSPFMIRYKQGVLWEVYLNEAIKKSAENGELVEINFCWQLGCLYRLQGRLTEAEEVLEKALLLCQQHNYSSCYGAVLTELAFVTRLATKYNRALTYCKQALAQAQVSVTVQAEAHNVIGLVAYDRQQWKTALIHLEQAITLYRSLNNVYALARLLTNKGNVLQRLAAWDDAEATYKEAITHFKQVGKQIEPVELFKAEMNLGNIFLKREDYKGAIKQYQQALTIFEEAHYEVDKAYAYNNLGMAYRELNQWLEAERFFKAAIDIWRKLKNLYAQANVLDNLGELFLKKGAFKQAEIVLKQAQQVLAQVADKPLKAKLEKSIEANLVKAKKHR